MASFEHSKLQEADKHILSKNANFQRQDKLVVENWFVFMTGVIHKCSFVIHLFPRLPGPDLGPGYREN